MFKLISAVIRYFASGIKERCIDYQFCPLLHQTDATSIVNGFRRYALSSD